MKKVTFSTLLTICLLWTIAFAINFDLEMKGYTSRISFFRVENMNASILNIILAISVSTIGIFLVYFFIRWIQESKTNKISFIKFALSEISISKEDEREVEICNKASLSSIKFMDYGIIFGLIFFQYTKFYIVPLNDLVIFIIFVITIRELYYLYKWYKFYKVDL